MMEFNDWQIAIVVIFVLLLVWLSVQGMCLKVYRFARPSCPYCVQSQDEWESFKRRCWFRLIKPVDINTEKISASEQQLRDYFNASSVPTIIFVQPSGYSKKYEGDRTANDILSKAEELI